MNQTDNHYHLQTKTKITAITHIVEMFYSELISQAKTFFVILFQFEKFITGETRFFEYIKKS